MNKIQIVIVDDHALFRKSLRVLIDLFARYQVLFDAANGQDFIARLDKENLPDIVLMDISMPLMDGYSATAWLKEHYPDIKVLALSTMDADTAIIKMIRCGAKGYVLKDADPEELKLAFDEVQSRGYFYNELVTRKVMNAVRQLTETKSEINLFVKLNQREIDFLRLSCTELAYKEIADRMCVSVRTVEGYRDALCEKLNLKTRVGLAVYAIKNNITEIKST
jgi:DNA-binding NarL/FixJ family response regulator